MDERIFLDEASDYFKIRQDRRDFMGKLLLGSAGAALGSLIPGAPVRAATVEDKKSLVSFTTGADRRDNVLRVLKPLEKEIREGVKGKQVIIKVNMVGNNQQLCATHPDAVRGVLDFLKPFYKQTVLVAESTGRRYDNTSGTFNHFQLYKYPPLEKEYNAKLYDLNTRPAVTEWVISETGHPLDIRIIDSFYDPKNYIISLCMLKTHNSVVATFSVKNIMMGAPINDDTRHEKRRIHTAGLKGFNFNLFVLAQKLQPELTVIDGLEGMEGNGPAQGTPVDHKVALASADFIAADRVACQLIGLDFGDVGYLTYCANAGVGQGDLAKIQVVGGEPSQHVIKYKLQETAEKQIAAWKN
ncbi:MAG: DUF362 domain-containing protein [Candidatus Latescibacterota bacterium]